MILYTNKIYMLT